MPRLRLSVAMPNYNHAAFLPAAIESVVAQSRPPDEFLILDDASTDDSISIIEDYAARYPIIRVFRNAQNRGVHAAHQRLFEMAQGDFLYGAAADDDRYPTFFERAMEMAERHQECGLVFGAMHVMNRDGDYLTTIQVDRWKTARYVSPAEYLRDYLEVEPPLHSLTVSTIFRRAALAEVGWLRPELGSFADTFAARAIALKHGACYVPEPFSKWRRMAGSVSQSTTREARKMLDLSAAICQCMLSPEFRDRFPREHVTRWRRRLRRQVLWHTLLGESDESPGARPNFLVRNFRRLARIPRLIPLCFYSGR